MNTIKNILVLMLITATGLALTSCSKDFLDRKSTVSLKDTNALNSIEDIKAATIGMYESFTNLAGAGRNQFAIPELMTDICYIHEAGSNNLQSFQDMTFTVSNGDIYGVYDVLYENADRAARVIQGSRNYLQKESLTLSERNDIRRCLAQAYGVKALAHFFLVNWFALPYHEDYVDEPGIILVGDKPYLPTDEFKRSTIGETYKLICNDIDSALAVYDVCGELETNVYFLMNSVAVNALKARVYLYMQEWGKAYTAATYVLTRRPVTGIIDMTRSNTYIRMWTQNETANSEDIFTIGHWARTLAANSLANFWGVYGCVLSSEQLARYSASDRRLTYLVRNADSDIYGKDTNARSITKYTGGINANGNSRIFSVPEMCLIQAEALAQQDDVSGAKTALIELVKRRNASYSTASQLPGSDKDALLEFIAEERCRELVGEGHRLFDLRRTFKPVSRTARGKTYSNWEPFLFRFPIPDTEVRAAKISQNDDWYQKLP